MNPASPVLPSVQFKATLWATVPPVPVKAEVGLVEALLTKVNVAEAVPDICGAKVRVTGMLCPAASVTGNVTPLRRNSELLIDPEEIVTLEPIALRLPDCVEVLPTVTVPKLAEVGVRVSCPCAVPVPDKAMARLGLEAFEVIEIPPVTLPATVGENDAVNDRLCPRFRVAGRVKPLIENPVPVTVACDRLTLVPPELVIV